MAGFAVNRRPSVCGFTLIEVMVSLAIIATALIPIFYLFSQTVDAEENSRFYTVAPLLANEKMAAVKSGLTSYRGVSTGDFEAFPGYHWRLEVNPVDGRWFGLDEAATDLKQLDVTVFSAGRRRQQYHLRSYEFLRQP